MTATTFKYQPRLTERHQCMDAFDCALPIATRTHIRPLQLSPREQEAIKWPFIVNTTGVTPVSIEFNVRNTYDVKKKTLTIRCTIIVFAKYKQPRKPAKQFCWPITLPLNLHHESLYQPKITRAEFKFVVFNRRQANMMDGVCTMIILPFVFRSEENMFKIHIHVPK